MRGNVEQWRNGSSPRVGKDNDVIRLTNALNHISGDGFILVNRTSGGGVSFKLALDRVLSRIPASGGGIASIEAIVIESTSEPDFTADPETEPELYTGRSWYTCRLLGDSTTIYNADTHYILGGYCLYNTIKYKSILADEGEAPNQYQHGHQPDTSPTYWEKQEEIRVMWVRGCENVADFDIRDCSPKIAAGETVEICSAVVEEVTRYYFANPTLFHCGNSIINNGTDVEAGFA